MPSDSIPEFDPIPFASKATIANANRVVKALNSLHPLTGTGGIHVRSTGHGATIAPATQDLGDGSYVGVIVSTGPAGTEADMTDSRYWVAHVGAVDVTDPQAPLTSTLIQPYGRLGGASNLGDTYDATAQAAQYTRCVTNLAEVPAQTHNLAIGSYVRVFHLMTQVSDPASTSSEPQPVFVMHEGPPVVRYAKVTVVSGSAFTLTARPCHADGTYISTDTTVTVTLTWLGPMVWAAGDIVRYVQRGSATGEILRGGNLWAGGQGASCWVKITSAATGQGKYNGIILNEAVADIAATTSVAADLPTNGSTCLVVNLAELNGSGHLLSTTATPTTFLGRMLWRNSSGTYVVGISGAQWEACT